MILREVLKYSVVGIINTLVGYGVFMVALLGLQYSPELANVIGYTIAFSVSFFLNRFFVFTNTNISLQMGLRFVIAFFVAFAANFGTLVILVRCFLVLPEIAQIFAMIVYTIIFYVLNKNFVFMERNFK